MYRHLRHPTKHTHWRIFAGVLLLAFVLRAMIAVGYMPTPASAEGGRFGMTLCVQGLSASALKILALDDTPVSVEPQALDCAFGAAIAPAVLPLSPDVSIAAPLNDIYVAIWRGAAPAFAQAWRGPPLGARGPPLAA
ncbi:hypothetical protein CR159_07485 [Pollutimonas subterranea]|uniref:DUF2946 domain-containing protein n=1 Tax=Pollutimonas subterranea TaxID=2045210 RepID=A0A2N4U5L8_9BURK|nr:hypothetical protein [Pollutimonas subterranea]PLC50297.1 hypothetical protein CR159_07485 [Pollutimonas subterranea]